MDDTSKTLRRWVTFAGCVLVVVVLHWAQTVLVPIALGIGRQAEKIQDIPVIAEDFDIASGTTD